MEACCVHIIRLCSAQAGCSEEAVTWMITISDDRVGTTGTPTAVCQSTPVPPLHISTCFTSVIFHDQSSVYSLFQLVAFFLKSYAYFRCFVYVEEVILLCLGRDVLDDVPVTGLLRQLYEAQDARVISILDPASVKLGGNTVMDAQGEEFRAETDGELRGDPASHPEHLCSGGQKVQRSWSDCVEDRTVIQEKRRFYCYPGTAGQHMSTSGTSALSVLVLIALTVTRLAFSCLMQADLSRHVTWSDLPKAWFSACLPDVTVTVLACFFKRSSDYILLE